MVDGLGCKMSYKFPSIRIESVFEGAPVPRPGDGALDGGPDPAGDAVLEATLEFGLEPKSGIL